MANCRTTAGSTPKARGLGSLGYTTGVRPDPGTSKLGVPSVAAGGMPCCGRESRMRITPVRHATGGLDTMGFVCRMGARAHGVNRRT